MALLLMATLRLVLIRVTSTHSLQNVDLSTNLMQLFVDDYVTEYTNYVHFSFDQIYRGVSTW